MQDSLDYDCPPFSIDFPAKCISTSYEWEDLVVDPQTRSELEDIVSWVRNKAILMDEWELSRHLKPGYRCFFYGPAGTGKTLSACLLGKTTGLLVYRVELSTVVSKYIGETEKKPRPHLFPR